jgi:Na+-transporting methylmalonyl-CoA/oxaloacetate decarboxylase gamma subunit
MACGICGLEGLFFLFGKSVLAPLRLGVRFILPMKPYLLIAGLLLAVLNGLLLLPATRGYIVPIAAIGLVLALLVVALSFIGSVESSAISEPAQTAVSPPPPVTFQTPAPAMGQVEAEVVAFFALLQEKGRLVDFLMEEITSYDDAQVGAAARVIHQGCRQVLQEHFKITAVSEAEEGSQITVPTGYFADEYRIVGKVSGEPPFKGKLIHKGWKTESVKLPRIVQGDGKRLLVIAPAEVELK